MFDKLYILSIAAFGLTARFFDNALLYLIWDFPVDLRNLSLSLLNSLMVLMMVIDAFLSSCHKKAIVVLYFGPILACLGVNHFSKSSK